MNLVFTTLKILQILAISWSKIAYGRITNILKKALMRKLHFLCSENDFVFHILTLDNIKSHK